MGQDMREGSAELRLPTAVSGASWAPVTRELREGRTGLRFPL